MTPLRLPPATSIPSLQSAPGGAPAEKAEDQVIVTRGQDRVSLLLRRGNVSPFHPRVYSMVSLILDLFHWVLLFVSLFF